MPIRHILVATDGSATADRAVEAAAELARAISGDLLIVTIGENRVTEDIAKVARAEGDIGDALELISKGVLLQAKERAERAGAINTRVSIGWSEPTEAIIDMARRENADIIVVGRRGRGQLAGLLLGSVSQKLVSLAPCLVLVVP